MLCFLETQSNGIYNTTTLAAFGNQQNIRALEKRRTMSYPSSSRDQSPRDGSQLEPPQSTKYSTYEVEIANAFSSLNQEIGIIIEPQSSNIPLSPFSEKLLPVPSTTLNTDSQKNTATEISVGDSLSSGLISDPITDNYQDLPSPSRNFLFSSEDLPLSNHSRPATSSVATEPGTSILPGTNEGENNLENICMISKEQSHIATNCIHVGTRSLTSTPFSNGFANNLKWVFFGLAHTVENPSNRCPEVIQLDFILCSSWSKRVLSLGLGKSKLFRCRRTWGGLLIGIIKIGQIVIQSLMTVSTLDLRLWTLIWEVSNLYQLTGMSIDAEDSLVAIA